MRQGGLEQMEPGELLVGALAVATQATQEPATATVAEVMTEAPAVTGIKSGTKGTS